MHVSSWQIGGANGEFIAVLIAQQLTDDTVYYYEDMNYVLLEIQNYSVADSDDEILQLNQDKIDLFKLTNDWNNELVISKCYSKSASDFDRDFSDVEDDILQYSNEMILDELYGKAYRIFCMPLDTKNNIFIATVYIEVDPVEGEEDPFYDMYFVIYDAREMTHRATYIHIDDQLDYSVQLQEFKLEYGWY